MFIMSKGCPGQARAIDMNILLSYTKREQSCLKAGSLKEKHEALSSDGCSFSDAWGEVRGKRTPWMTAQAAWSCEL